MTLRRLAQSGLIASGLIAVGALAATPAMADTVRQRVNALLDAKKTSQYSEHVEMLRAAALPFILRQKIDQNEALPGGRVELGYKQSTLEVRYWTDAARTESKTLDCDARRNRGPAECAIR